jgi:hypothetical protein
MLVVELVDTLGVGLKTLFVSLPTEKVGEEDTLEDAVEVAVGL